jgi:hypothetical protein
MSGFVYYRESRSALPCRRAELVSPGSATSTQHSNSLSLPDWQQIL